MEKDGKKGVDVYVINEVYVSIKLKTGSVIKGYINTTEKYHRVSDFINGETPIIIALYGIDDPKVAKAFDGKADLIINWTAIESIKPEDDPKDYTKKEITHGSQTVMD